MGANPGPAVLIRPAINPLWGKVLPTLFFPAPTLSEDLYVCCIGHAFGQLPPFLRGGYFVHDFLVDQSQSTGGGSFLSDPIQFDLTQSRGYMYRISSSCGKHVQINLPVSVTSAYFSAYLGRQVTNPTGGFFDTMTAQVSFEGLIGTPPNITYNTFSITDGDNQALTFEIEGEVTSSLQFDGILLYGNFSRDFDPGAKWYNPLSYAVPFGTKDIYPKSETFVLFGYHTSDPVDPGPFVTLA